MLQKAIHYIAVIGIFEIKKKYLSLFILENNR